jgi:hypothetical protein
MSRGPAGPPLGTRAFTLALSALLAAGAFAARTGEAATGSPWSLSPDQRRAFLRSYAPIILKQADEGRDGVGHEWITNYDFDRDGFYLPNNGENWARELAGFVREGRHPEWRIRPTLYTSIVEFTRGDVKSAVLLYHIYHAMDGTHTHDWERIEIRLDGLRGGPGSGERIRYVVLTRHHRSVGRRPPHEDLNFLETDGGRHLLVWQAAQSSRWGRPRKGELHFVRSELAPPAHLDREVGLARIGLDTGNEEAFHYVFVPRADTAAVDGWRARGIDACNAMSLASGAGRAPVPMRDLRRITYELQDMADVFPHQWRVPGNGSWGEPAIRVLLERPLVDEDGKQVVPAGPQEFRNGALDLRFGRDDGRGFIGKNAFWGTYLFERRGWFGNTGFLGEALEEGAARAARCRANGLPDCANGALWQHDIFVHEGVRARGRAENENGRWLEGRWYEAAAGGFDGRWVQLFPDHPEPDVPCAAAVATR